MTHEARTYRSRDCTYTVNRVNASTRVRRAIHLHDLVLLKRIIKSNPQDLQNPDIADNGNTSLHLAANLGLLEIAEFLVETGHEDRGISRNANWDTPLHLAVETSEAVAELLANRFPRCIGWKNRQGADALMLAARSPHTSLIPLLLTLSPAIPLSPPTSSPYSPTNNLNPTNSLLSSTDTSGNTPLHYASAYGRLKSIRTLLEHGADPSARNEMAWDPVAYSASVQAEVYFKGLVNVAEREREGIREAMVMNNSVGGGGGGGARSRGGSGGSGGRGTPGGVRLVDEEREEEWMRMRAASGAIGGSAGRVRTGSGE